MKRINALSAWATGMLLCTFAIVLPALAQDAPKLSDAEVASVAVVANQIDIDHARIAKERSKDPQVLRFAQTMINDHKAVIDQAVALVQKLGVTPEDNAVSKQLLSDAAKTDKMLRSKSGQAFNKAYVDNEVAYHKAVIGAVEGLLIPESENAELKELLQNVVPALKAHLEHAQMLQKELQGK
jgi:putative membrane protein